MTPVQPLTDRDLYRLVQLHDAPDFVKDAGSDQFFGDPGDDSATFADPLDRRFSLKTKAAVWASAADFAGKSQDYQPTRRALIQDRIAAAGAHFGISDELAKLAKAASEPEADPPADLPDSHYAWVRKEADGSIDRRLRVHEAAEVSEAAGWLLRHRDAFEHADRMKIARRILARERELGGGLVENRDALDKVAAFGAADRAAVVDALYTRMRLLRTKEASAEATAALSKIAEDVQSRPDSLASERRRVKLAGLIDALDRGYDLTASYDRDGLPRPEDSVFAITEKTAKDYIAQFVPLKNGSLYQKSALAGVDLFQIRDYVGGDVADRFTGDGMTCDPEKFAAYAPELSRVEADLLQSVLEAQGVKPAHKTAAAAPRLDKQALRELAATAE